MNPALEQIWNELADRLRQFILRRVSDPADAEDVLQDVFLKISRRADELPDPAKLEGWVFLIARNAIIDYYRTRKSSVELPDTLAAEDDFAPREIEELKTSFRRMIHSLPGPYREAILLTEFEGLSQVELARRLGLSVSAAKSRVQRARQQLKEMLLDCCQFEFDRRGRVIDCRSRDTNCPECAGTEGAKNSPAPLPKGFPQGGER